MLLCTASPTYAAEIPNLLDLIASGCKHKYGDLLQDYNNGYKHIAMIAGGWDVGVELSITMLIDLDDYLGISEEGKGSSPYVSIWTFVDVGIGVSFPPLVSVGFSRWEKEPTPDVPSYEQVTAGQLFLSGYKLSAVDWDSLSGNAKGWDTSDFALNFHATILSYSACVYHAEISKSLLKQRLDITKPNIADDGAGFDSYSLTFSAGLFVIEFNKLGVSFNTPEHPEQTWQGFTRPFTCGDDGTPCSAQLAFEKIIGGKDTDGDGITNMVFPIVAEPEKDESNPNNKFLMRVRNVGNDEILWPGLKADKSNLPPGWYIGNNSINDTTRWWGPNHTLPNQYLDSEWYAACTMDARSWAKLKFITCKTMFCDESSSEQAEKVLYFFKDNGESPPSIENVRVDNVLITKNASISVPWDHNVEIEAYVPNLGESYSNDNTVLKSAGRIELSIGQDSVYGVGPFTEFETIFLNGAVNYQNYEPGIEYKVTITALSRILDEETDEYIVRDKSNYSFYLTFIKPDNKPYFSDATISPQTPTTNDNLQFTVQYNDEDNDPVDANSIKVVVDGNQIAMTGSSNLSGTTFSTTGQKFAKGTHSYYFTGTQNSILFRYPDGSQTLSFSVVESVPNGLSIAANPSSLSICSQASAQIIATLTSNGVPIAGKEVAFTILSGDGYLYPLSAMTDENGIARSTYTPESTGTTVIGAIINALPVVQTNVVVGNCSVNIESSMSLKSCSSTSSIYKIKATITDLSGNPIQNTDATVKVKDTAGAAFGSISDYDGNTGNPLSTETDNYGWVETFLSINQTSDITYTISCMGTERVVQGHVNAGCQPPINILPFTSIGPFGSIYNSKRMPNAISVSPDGKKIAVVSGVYILIYDISFWKRTGGWTVWHSLKQPYENSTNEAYAVAYSPDGKYLAAGFAPSSTHSTERPALLVWNVGDEPAAYTEKFRAMTDWNTFNDVFSIAWSPDSTQIMTGERYSSTYLKGGVARIWNLSGMNTWTSPGQAFDAQAVAWSSAGYKAIGFGEDTVWIYNSFNSRTADIITFGNGEPNALAWNKNGDSLAVATDPSGSHSPIYVYDVNGIQKSNFTEHSNTVADLDWNRTTERLASCGWGELIKVWDPSGTNLYSFSSAAGYFNAKWSPDGEILFARTQTNIDVFAPNDNLGPDISILSPFNNSQTKSPAVLVSGSITDPHLINNATTQVNSGTPTSLITDSSGSFSTEINLSEGSNTIIVNATDNAGNTSNASITITRLAINPDFVLTISPQGHTVGQSGTVHYTLSLTSSDGFNSPVTLSAGPLPEGVSAIFTPNSTSPPFDSDLALTISTSTPAGLYPITINAVGGGKNHATSLDLVVTQPSVNVRQGSTQVPNDTGSFSFGNVSRGTNRVMTFAIENLGSFVLNLTGSPVVNVSGAQASEFVVTLQPTSSVQSLESVNFSITFTPAGSGVRTASVSITNNDASRNPYNFTVNGNGIDDSNPNLSITSHTNNQVISASSITLSGSASDAGKGDSGIRQITVNGNRANNDMAAGSGTANWTKSISLAKGDNVIFIEAFDNSEFSNRTTQVINISSILNLPILSSPASNAINQPTAVTVQWIDTNSNPQETGYRVRFKEDGAGTYNESSDLAIGTTSYLLTNLAAGKKYWWSVKTVGNETTPASSAYAADWSFTVAHPTIPVIQVKPDSLSFGYVPIGSTKALTLTVKNTGGGTLTGNATTNAPFTVSNGSYSLGADQSKIVTVQYQPTSQGSHTGTITFTGGDGATVQVTGKTEKNLGLPSILQLLLGD